MESIEEIINSNEEHLNNYFENRESNDNSEKDLKNFRENIKKIINSDSYQNNKKELEDLKYRDVKNEINNIKSKNIKLGFTKYTPSIPTFKPLIRAKSIIIIQRIATIKPHKRDAFNKLLLALSPIA